MHWMWRWLVFYLEVSSCSHSCITMILLDHLVALVTCLQSPERYLLLRWAALTSLSDQVILTALRAPQIDHPPGFSWPNGPNRAGPYLTNNQAQLHLGWISLDDSLSLGFILPHLHLLKKMIHSQLINLN